MNFFKTFMAVIVANIVMIALAVGVLMIIGLAATISGSDDVEVADNSYLVIDLYGAILPYDPPQSLGARLFEDDPLTFHDIQDNLEKALADTRINGVILNISSANDMGNAMRFELRQRIKDLRGAGKTVIAYSDRLSRSAYYVATACDKIYMPPPADVIFTGMGGKYLFMRGMLDKIDVEPNIHKIKDYKSAAETTNRKNFSEPARENRKWILDELWDMQISAMKEDRGLSDEQIDSFAEYVMYTAEEALAAGIIDGVMYWDEMEDMLAGDDEELSTVTHWSYNDISRESVGLKGKHRIAIVHAHGALAGRSSRVDPMMGFIIGHRTASRAIRAAADNDKVDAIVLRVDSPGGETLTSDLISRAVEYAVERKPVVVSMLDVAASGGYYISYKANKMVANPNTVTGSIGSILGKMNIAGAYEKLGFSFDGVDKGANANFWSPVDSFSPEQWERLKDYHYKSFNAWLQDVADRRGMTFEEAEKLAHGRVWTGRQAKDNGLIDELGGLPTAIRLAKEEAGLDPEEEVTLVNYPREKSLMELLTSRSSWASLGSWAAYRFVQEDLKQSYELITSGQLEYQRLEALSQE